MKTVTDAFKNALRQNRTEITREIAYKRRRWVQEDQAFAWEDDWTVVSGSEFVSASPVTEQLDSEQLNEFKVSNITLVLRNERNVWREDNPFGRFAQDDASPLHPYNPYWTKFRVRTAVTLRDGTTEYLTLFTGVAVEFTFASNDQVQITVQGLESLLMNANAEDVSTLVEEENAGTGNGSNTEFVTDNPGVGLIDEVSVNGIRQVAGTDYDVSDLDDPTIGAKVTFTVAPSGGAVVRITYRYWQQNKRIEELVASLLTVAWIAEADQMISPVVFSQPIQNAVVVDSQSDWQSGTPTSIDSNTVPGRIKIDILDPANYQLLDDFSDHNFTANPVWTPEGTAMVWSMTGTDRLRYDRVGPSSEGGVIHVPTSRAQIGYWSWLMNGVDASFDKVTIAFMAESMVFMTFSPFSPYTFKGNYIRIRTPPYVATPTWELYIKDVLVASAAYNMGLADHTVSVARFSNGVTNVYVDGNLILSGQSTAVTSPTWFGIGGETGAFLITDREFDNFYHPKDTFSAEWISQAYDLGAGLISIGKMFTNHHLNVGAGSIYFHTRASDDGISWGPWVQVANSGQVLSDVKRYLQIRVQFSSPSDNYDEPYVDSIRVEYQTNVANITLAKFTGQTVYAAMQALGRFSNYEWGFTSDEDFFFRAKTVDKQADESLVREGDIQGVTGMTTGYDRVYSEVRVTYGQFTSNLKSPGDSPRDAKARVGSKVFEMSVGDIVIGNDADVASGVAKLFFAELTQPRRRLKAACRFLPYLDLSDTVLISYDQNRPKKSWHMGDETVALGDRDVNLWGPGEQIVSGMFAKVIGVRHDVQRYMTELDLQEVL